MTATPKTIRAASLTRISRDDEKDGLGVERQRQYCLGLVESKGWGIVHDGDADTFCDNNISGANDETKRPSFGRLIDAVKAGKVDAVVAYSQSRIYRDTAKFLGFLELLKEHGVEIVALVADQDINPSGSLFVATVIAAKDAEERRRVGELVANKKQELADAGLPSGGARQFGWEPGGMVPRECEAAEIGWAAQRIIDGGTLGDVIRGWQEREVASVKGKRTADGKPHWSRTVVRQILTAPRQAGLRKHRGEIVGQAAWPAILDEPTWRACCALLLDHPERRPPQPTKKYPLKGALVCGACGTRLSGQSRGPTDPRGDERFYYCNTDTRGCGASVKADPVESYVSAVVASVAESSDARSMLEAQQDFNKDELADLVTEKVAADGRLKALEDKWARDDIKRAAYVRNARTFQAEIDALDARITTIRATATHRTIDGTLIESWDTLDPNERMLVLQSMVSEIKVAPRINKGRTRTFDHRRVEFVWRTSALALAAGVADVPENFTTRSLTDFLAYVTAVTNMKSAGAEVPQERQREGGDGKS